MSKLNSDILYLIFQELNDDRNSIFSWLLVNKFWCKLIVPILWRNPLKYIKLKREKNLKLNIISNIIILHLSEESRNFLKSKDINIIPTEQQNLSFNYVSFCKYVDIIQVISSSIGLGRILTSSQLKLLREELFKLFISKCSNIIFLKTSNMIYMEDYNYLRHYSYPIYDYPGANISLSNLCELNCRSDNHYSLFRGLAKICRVIEKITVVLNYENHYLAELIKVQNKIKYIKLIDESDIYYQHDIRFKNIFQALEKQAYSILYLNSDCMNSSFLLSKFVNLETLILSKNCDFENLGTTSYSNLQILELGHSATLNIVTNIIQNTNGNLWKIKIKVYNFETSREYIQAIYKCCPNMKYASIYLNNQNLDDDVVNFLIKCQYLEAIKIKIKDKNFDGEKFLNLLIRFAPISLYKVSINFSDFSIESLNLFFSNWKNRKTLHLYNQWHCYYYENYNFEEVVLKRDDFWMMIMKELYCKKLN